VHADGHGEDSKTDVAMEMVMKKVIEFYVPKNFRNPRKWAPQMQSGKVIEFCSAVKKSA
jgi:hypothetical protein